MSVVQSIVTFSYRHVNKIREHSWPRYSPLFSNVQLIRQQLSMEGKQYVVLPRFWT